MAKLPRLVTSLTMSHNKLVSNPDEATGPRLVFLPEVCVLRVWKMLLQFFKVECYFLKQ